MPTLAHRVAVEKEGMLALHFFFALTMQRIQYNLHQLHVIWIKFVLSQKCMLYLK